jgi:hypothetical protein
MSVYHFIKELKVKDMSIKMETSSLSARDKVASVVNMLKIDHSLASLKDSLMILNKIKNGIADKNIEKLSAEINYLIALEYKKLNKKQEMRKYAKISINLYNKCKITTLEDSLPILSELLPDHMHEGVVKSRIN